MTATDELRKLADRMDGLVLETPDMLRDAADEIDKLHAELTDLRLMSCPSCGIKVENERLREQIHWLKQGDILHVLTDQEYIDQCERERLMQVSIDELDKENDELRELCVKALEWLRWAGGITCPPEVPDKFADELRELGVDA